MAIQPKLTPSERPGYDWQIEAPAKINRFLHVLGRRPDRYHNLQTGFQFLSWGDRLHVNIDAPWEVSGLDSVPDSENLVYRAGMALANFADIAPQGQLHIEKHIPAGAGLGGGSSDAASALLMLRTLWKLEMSDLDLARIGQQLGADVPIFIHGKSAIGTGIGEQLESIEWPCGEIELFLPQAHVSTRDIFTDKWLTRDSQAINMRAALAGQGHNDCEAVCRKHFPTIDRLFDCLAQWQPKLSGSGGTVFVLHTQVPQLLNLPNGVKRQRVHTTNLSSAVTS